MASSSADGQNPSDRASIRSLLDEIQRTACKVHVDVAKEMKASIFPCLQFDGFALSRLNGQEISMSDLPTTCMPHSAPTDKLASLKVCGDLLA